MDIRLNNKTAVITGGAKGIGAAVAALFVDSGAKVFVLDTDSEANDLRSNSDVCFLKCDVSNESQVSAAFSQILAQSENIDILINNAGIQTYGSITETSEELWDRTFNVNVKAMYLCAKYAIPQMGSGRPAAIINVSSVQALICQQKVAAYASSKAAILGLTRSIAVDYAPFIRCVAVCPGAVMTPMLMQDISHYKDQDAIIKETEEIHLANRISEAQEIAEFILFLASDNAGFITGHYYRIDGGIGVKLGGT